MKAGELAKQRDAQLPRASSRVSRSSAGRGQSRGRSGTPHHSLPERGAARSRLVQFRFERMFRVGGAAATLSSQLVPATLVFLDSG